ncbi:DUF4342 domain-containing protein [Phormidium sp. LEGE 05292]|uniref:DUF4342 domain-containing protein n=1 Tax=[Phormidium] sp. LEGE 05292 TaxID=767427 RepID=UPI00187E364E|nr:DUF4342 domain-containing protein [Phormidium sp. LEGE 05292]MBE9226777.1 DUF4342 domain-containing protein [Phormidium sp. LEGE 05292]
MNAQFETIENQAPTVIVEPNTVEEVETATENQEKVRVEEVKFNRDTVADFYKNVVGKTENRYLIVKNKQGRVLTEIPLLVGVPGLVVGTVVFPFAAAVVAVAATVANLTVAIERKQ